MILKYGVYIYTPKALGLKKEGQTVIAQRIRAWKFEETITNTKSLSNMYYSNFTMHDVYKFKLCNFTDKRSWSLVGKFQGYKRQEYALA